MRMSEIVQDKHRSVSKVHIVAIKAQRPLKPGRRLRRREAFSHQLTIAESLSEVSLLVMT